jgi:hypothetical protein
VERLAAKIQALPGPRFAPQNDKMPLAANCPKCEHAREPGRDACAHCGLLVTLWDGYRASQGVHPMLDGLWAAVEADWGDEEAHARFVDQAVASGRLDVAAARYRQWLRGRPGDRQARAGLARVGLLAERLHAVSLEGALARAPSSPWSRLLVAVLALVLLVAALGLLRFALR